MNTDVLLNMAQMFDDHYADSEPIRAMSFDGKILRDAVTEIEQMRKSLRCIVEIGPDSRHRPRGTTWLTVARQMVTIAQNAIGDPI